MTRYGFPACPTPEKHHFLSEGRAEVRLEQIVRDPEPWRDKNPHRYYECPCGGGWTLSSTDWDPDLLPPEPPTLRVPRPARGQEEKRLRRHRR